MNKVIAIHLHGTAFQLEEGGYETLRSYLDNAVRQLDGNPDKAEILADIEQAIADKFTTRLTAGRNVVLTAEVEAVIIEIGPVTNGSDPATDDKAGAKSSSGQQPTNTGTMDSVPTKRLYRILDGAMISGVCNGLAAYLGVDVTLLRLAVVVLCCFSAGTLMIAYIVARFVIPEAKTPEQKAAASGPSQTAHDFVRMAREGYYEGMKSFPDRQARREWKRKFKRDMRDWKSNFQWQPSKPSNVSTPGGTCPAPSALPVATPLPAILNALLIFAFWFVIFSLITTHAVFGIYLPWGLPFWVGIILAVVAYNAAVSPIKALRRSYYYRQHGQPYYWNPLAALWQGLLTLCILAFFIFLADRFFPRFHPALLGLPDCLRAIAENIQQWWNGR
jgi:phage shock protein PspC (stress-responsive transcriptional regulator)